METTIEIRQGVVCTKYPQGSKLKGTPILSPVQPQEKPTIDDFFELYAMGKISEDVLNRAIFEL